jgi:hypothetical protein
MKAAPLPRDPKQRDASWSQGLSPSVFRTRHVDVWRVRLDEPARAGSEASVLSSDEIARAGRFHFEKDRIRFSRCPFCTSDAPCRLPCNSGHRDPLRVSDQRKNLSSQPSRIRARYSSMYLIRQTWR